MKLDFKTRPSRFAKFYAVAVSVLLVLYGNAALRGQELFDDARDTVPSEERASAGRSSGVGFIYIPGYRGGK